MEDPTHKKLDELLARLPREVAPPRNLWPGIARQIEPRPNRLGAFALAASIAVTVVAAALVWVVLRGGPSGLGPSANAATQRFDEPRNPAYLAARADVEKSFRERLALLEPRTRAKIEANLALIRRAHEEIRRALAEQPSNPVLEHLLESTLHDEFDLYDSVVRGSQPTMARI